MSHPLLSNEKFVRSMFWVSIFYFSLYFAYQILFIDLVSELNHWLTLVTLPFVILLITMKLTVRESRFTDIFAILNIRKTGLLKNLMWGILIGTVMGFVQVMLSRQSSEIMAAIKNGSFFYKFPVAIIMMLMTAGFTEEFMFRGFIQTSLQNRLKSGVWAVLVASALFGIYHFPFAFYKESWPSHGNFWGAIQEGVLFAFIAGLIIGGCYAKFKSLVVPVIIHAMFNAVWFSTKINI